MPFFTIGIPTYNRLIDLKRNLESICNQIGDNKEIELLISDNASTDGTEALVREYQKKYSYITYFKNKENLGVSKNINLVFKRASGKYCMLHGDDDLYLPDSISTIINYIKADLDCAVYYWNYYQQKEKVEVNCGLDNFLKTMSYVSTAISRLIINTSVYNKIPDKDLFDDSYIPQIYVIYRLLSINNKYMSFNGNYLRLSGAATTAYDYGEVFMNNYFGILKHFIPYGLSMEAIKAEKAKILTRFIVPYYKKRQEKPVAIRMQDVVPCFVKNYKDEPYFEEYYKILLEIQKDYKW